MTELKKILGYKIGDFTPDNGEPLHYIHLFVCYPRNDVKGCICDTFKVASDDVLKDVKIGDFAEFYFNDPRKVVLINVLEPTDDDLSQFMEV